MVSNCYSLTVIEWKQDPERLCCHFSHSKIAKLHNGGLTLHSKTLQNVALCHKKGLRLKYYIKNRPKIVWPFLEPFVIHEPAWNIRRQKTFRSFFKLTFYCILTNKSTFPLTEQTWISIRSLSLTWTTKELADCQGGQGMGIQLFIQLFIQLVQLVTFNSPTTCDTWYQTHGTRYQT